jgi:hypothetical protein
MRVPVDMVAGALLDVALSKLKHYLSQANNAATCKAALRPPTAATRRW